MTPTWQVIPQSTPDSNNKLCEALLDQDLTEIIINADYGINFTRLMTTKKLLKISLDYFLSTTMYNRQGAKCHPWVYCLALFDQIVKR